MSTAGAQYERDTDARIEALRRHRAEKAAQAGVSPAAVRMTTADIDEAIDKADAAPKPTDPRPSLSTREQDVLDAARSLYGGSGAARPSEIARRMGVSDIAVSKAIAKIREKGLWPYAPAPMGRAPGSGFAKKAKPNLACLDVPRQAPQPAVERQPPSQEPNAYGAMLAALDAVNALPGDARAALVAHLNRS